jgi:hypothetical protein
MASVNRESCGSPSGAQVLLTLVSFRFPNARSEALTNNNHGELARVCLAHAGRTGCAQSRAGPREPREAVPAPPESRELLAHSKQTPCLGAHVQTAQARRKLPARGERRPACSLVNQSSVRTESRPYDVFTTSRTVTRAGGCRLFAEALVIRFAQRPGRSLVCRAIARPG